MAMAAEIVVPESITLTISGMRLLGDVVTNLSTAGIAAVILTWARVLGIYKDADLSGFRRPLLLTVPLALFVLAVIAGYALGSSLTGFFFEITHGSSMQGYQITDATEHFKREYWKFSFIGLVQLLTSICGILTLSGWFLWNVYIKTRVEGSES
jgi:hypothetical protein